MTIDERIERLERTNRRYRRILVLLGAIALGTVTISAAQEAKVPGLITAKAFNVVDDDGHVLVRLGAGNGAGGIALTDAKGVVTVALASTMSDGVRTGFIYTQRGGKKGVTMTSGTDGNGSVSLYNSEEKKVVNVTSTRAGDGAVVIYDQSGKVAVAILSQEQGGALTVYNQKRESICIISAYSNGAGLLTIFDQNGQVQRVDK